jgi:uncharacterized protein YacL
MTEQPAPEPELPETRPDIRSLFEQLSSDTASFARAEVRVLKAQVGERAAFAAPAMILFVAGVALIIGVVIALLLGVMLWLAPALGFGWAILIVVAAGVATSALLFKLGTNRISAMFKMKDET